MISPLPSTLEPDTAPAHQRVIEVIDLTKPEPPQDHWVAMAFALGLTIGALRHLFVTVATACKSAY